MRVHTRRRLHSNVFFLTQLTPQVVRQLGVVRARRPVRHGRSITGWLAGLGPACCSCPRCCCCSSASVRQSGTVRRLPTAPLPSRCCCSWINQSIDRPTDRPNQYPRLAGAACGSNQGTAAAAAKRGCASLAAGSLLCRVVYWVASNISPECHSIESAQPGLAAACIKAKAKSQRCSIDRPPRRWLDGAPTAQQQSPLAR